MLTLWSSKFLHAPSTNSQNTVTEVLTRDKGIKKRRVQSLLVTDQRSLPGPTEDCWNAKETGHAPGWGCRF